MLGMPGSLGASHPGELIVKLSVVALASVLLFGSGLSAASILVGDHFTVTFTSAAQGMFGDPVISAPKVLSWTPALFVVDSDAGTLTSETLVTITANAGWNLKKFSFSEGGIYEGGTITDPGTSTILVKADGYAKVTPLFSSAIQHNFATGNITTATFDAPSNTDNGFGHWSALASPITVNAAVSQVQFNAKDNLYAWASADGYSYIQMKAANLMIETVSAVPEPEAYTMVLAGLAAIGLVARRRRQD